LLAISASSLYSSNPRSALAEINRHSSFVVAWNEAHDGRVIVVVFRDCVHEGSAWHFDQGRTEAIKAFRFLPRDLTVEGGESTPTFRLRRAVVAKEFESVIADIYT